MDPVEFRAEERRRRSARRAATRRTRRPASRPASRRARSVRLGRGAQAARRATAPIRRGVGVAAGLWRGGSGGPPATIIVKLFADGSANLNMGASDIGTGTKTVMAMVVAEELGVPLERIQVEWADTGTTQYATPSGGSKTVPTESPAVRAAALDVKQQLLALAADAAEAHAAGARAAATARSSSTADPAEEGGARRRSTALRRRGLIVGVGYRGPNPEGMVICPFGAHFAEVEVNTRTGEVKVLRFLAAQDSGRVDERADLREPGAGRHHDGARPRADRRRGSSTAARPGRWSTATGTTTRCPTAMDVPAEQTVRADRPARLRGEHHGGQGARRAGHDSRPRRPSPTPSTTRAACGRPTRRSTRRGSSTLLAAAKKRG